MLKARIFFALLFVALPAASAVAGDAPPVETAAPAAVSTPAAALPLAVTPEERHEFGAVAEGTVLQYDFVVKNEGSAELVIDRVAPG